jgi:uncharacterized protein (DUF1501 family)
MFTLLGNKQSFCDGITRRSFLRVGALGLGGLTLADLLRLRAQAGSAEGKREHKSVIMIHLPGGPSHHEMYDPKPDAPQEIRGEFQPIQTSVPGIHISELLPLQAKIADKLAIVRGIDFLSYNGNDHSQEPLYTGFHSKWTVRPAFGSVVTRLQGRPNAPMPPYVSLSPFYDGDRAAYLGAAYRPFVPSDKGQGNLSLVKGVTAEQLQDRKVLLQTFDTLRRDIDQKGEMSGLDSFTGQALEMIATPRVRDAFDLSKEPENVKAKYGSYRARGQSGEVDPMKFLMARRLVEAGATIVTLAVGSWDDHGSAKEGSLFKALRQRLPVLDHAIHGLVTELHERGLDKQTAVLIWGEMGRTPKINTVGGRDHWSEAGCAVLAGGLGLRLGQVVGATDAKGAYPKRRIKHQNILATFYHLLGIDPATTLPDHNGRPQYLLDECDRIADLV